MKSHIAILRIFVFLIAGILASCEKVDFNEMEETSPSTIHVKTRGADDMGELYYPIHVFAFDESGKLKERKVLQSEDEDLTLSLPQGKAFKIVAISADEDWYEVPKNPTLSSSITMKNPAAPRTQWVCAKPLQMGMAEVLPSSGNGTLRIQMSHQVCSLNIILHNLPAECRAASVDVSSTYASLAFNLDKHGAESARIPLQQDPSGNKWTSGEVYMFPTFGEKTTFTISFNDVASEQYSSANYMANLKPAVPYVLEGTYSDGNILVTGTFAPAQWADPVTLNFTFGNSSNGTVTPDREDNGGTQTPGTGSSETTRFSIWNGHVVAAVLDDEGNLVDENSTTLPEYTLLLLSLEDWDKQTSVFNTTNPTEALNIAGNYTEFGLSGWTIPTEGQARMLYQLFNTESTDGAYSTLSDALYAAGAKEIVQTDDKGNNIRYLCQDAEKTFSFKTNSVTNAGATIKTYHLRLVRQVKVQATR